MIEKPVLSYLKRCHKGKNKAVPSRKLEAKFHVCGSTLRRAVLRLRLEGHPTPQGAFSCRFAAIHLVCSGQNGYYYANTLSELEDTIHRCNQRLYCSAQLKTALGRTRQNMCAEDQTSLFPQEGSDVH